MTRWNVALTLLALTLTPSSGRAADAPFVGCWDETFAYDVANVLQVADGFEITMNGSTLHGDSIQTQDGIEFQLESPGDARFIWHTELGLYVKLPPGACTLDVAGHKAQCEADIPAAASYRTAFVTWRQSDIDFSRTGTGAPIVGLATPGELSKISFELSEQVAKISLISNDGQNHVVTKVVRVDPYETVGKLICDLSLGSGSDYLTRGFPDRLRAYLLRH